MGCKRQSVPVAIIASALLMQSCAMMPAPPDHNEQKLVMERWNSCVQRAGLDADTACEGHKRDVLAMYPEHLERQISARMDQRAGISATSQMLKTHFNVVVR